MVQSNTTGFPDQTTTPHIPLYQVTVSGGSITAVTNKRDTTLDIQAAIKAQSFEATGADAYFKGQHLDLEMLVPYVRLKDTTDGTIRRLRVSGGKFNVTDDAGTSQNSDIVSPVDETDTNATKDKAVSNLLAKGWEDHRNASAPHAGHELTANKGIANGYAGLDVNVHVAQSVRYIQTSQAPAATGQIQVSGGELLYHDGTASRTVEKTSRKGAASGYCDLDASSLVPTSRLRAASSSTPGMMSTAHYDLVNGATDLATVSTLMKRDANGRAKVANPSAGGDIVNKTYADATYVPITRTVSAGTGLTGGGSLAADITLSVDQAFSPTWSGIHDFTGTLRAPRKVDPGAPAIGEIWINADKVKVRNNAGAPATLVLVDETRSIATGNGLTGGGNLSADRTLSVNLATDPGLEFSGAQLRVKASTGILRDANGISVIYGSGAGTAAQGNDSRIPTQDENDALVGTSGAPSSANKYVTDADSRLTNSRTPTGAAGGDLSGMYPNPSVPGATLYANVDTSVVPSTGDVIAQGVLFATPITGIGMAAVPGAFGIGPSLGTTQRILALTPMSQIAGTGLRGTGVPRGVKYYVKGMYKAIAAARLNTNFEKFAIGVLITTAANIVANADSAFGATVETSRDDYATVAVVVDNTDKIQRYNNSTAGDASYTDTTFVANLTAGMEFELIVEVPSTTNSDDDCKITISVRDSGGVMRTILNAVAPVSTAANEVISPLIMGNQDFVVTKLTYKVEKAA